jgi:hypothetical protein
MPAVSKLDEVLRILLNSKKPPKIDDLEGYLLSRGVKPDEIKHSGFSSIIEALQFSGVTGPVSNKDLEDFIKLRTDRIKVTPSDKWKIVAPNKDEAGRAFSEDDYFGNVYRSEKGDFAFNNWELAREPHSYKYNAPASVHFPEEDYIAHARGYDTPESRTIFELQSDVHNTGSRGRYGDPYSNFDYKDFDTVHEYREKHGSYPDRGELYAAAAGLNSDPEIVALANIFERYGRRYSATNNGVMSDQDIVKFFDSVADGDKLYTDPVKGVPDVPFKKDKWVTRTLERELDTAVKAGKPLEVLMDTRGKTLSSASRGQSYHDKYYAPGRKIDQSLKALAAKHGLNIEDVNTGGMVPAPRDEVFDRYMDYTKDMEDPLDRLAFLQHLTTSFDSPFSNELYNAKNHPYTLASYYAQKHRDRIPEIIERGAAIDAMYPDKTPEEILELMESGADNLPPYAFHYKTYYGLNNFDKFLEKHKNKPKETFDPGARYVRVTDPKNRAGKGLDYYEYGKLDPATAAALSATSGASYGLQQFLAKKQREQKTAEESMGLAAGDMSNYGTASQAGSGQNFANAAQNIGVDWLEQYYKGKNNIASMFYADDPNKYTSEMDYVKRLREKYGNTEGNPVYDVGSFLVGP